MRIGVVGSKRRIEQVDFIRCRKVILKYIDKFGEDKVRLVSGGCSKGGDYFAEAVAKEFGLVITICYPAWSKKGKAAGFIRNGKIASLSQRLIAVVAEDRTGGTEDTIKKFLKKLGMTEKQAVKKKKLILI